MTAQTKGQMLSLVASDFQDNESGAITPGILRSYENTLINSYADSGGSTVTAGVPVVYGDTTGIFLQPATALPITVSGLNQVISISHSVLGGPSGFPTGNALNLIDITSDTADLNTGGFLNGFEISWTFGGSATQGGRQGIYSYMQQTSPTSGSNTARFYLSGQFSTTTTSGDGGTDTGAGAAGAYYGSSSFGWLQSGATNCKNVTACEFDVAAAAGSSVRYKAGIQIAQHALDGVTGAALDTLIALTSEKTGSGLNYGIVFSDFGTGQPVSSTGTLVGISNPNSTTTAVANGIDLSAATFTGSAFKAPGFNVDGNGNVLSHNSFTYNITTASINFNASNTDNAISIALPSGFSTYRLQGVQIVNPSVTINGTATFNIYTAASGSGTAMYTGDQTMAITTSSANTAGNMQSAAPSNATTLALNVSTLYFRTKIAFGSAATATVIITICPLY